MSKRLFGLMAFVLLAMQCLTAEVYVLDNVAESTFETIGSKEYELDGRPAGYLTFDAKCVPMAILFWGGNLHVGQYVNGAWSEVTEVSFAAKDTYYSFGPFKLDRNATKIKLYTETGATGYKCIQNVRVTMATYVEASPAVLNFPQTELGSVTTANFTLAHSNVAQLTVSSDNNTVFTPNVTTITESGEGKYGSSTITVTYAPVEAGAQSAVITVGNGTQSALVLVGGAAVKRSQQIVWKDAVDVLAVGETLENAATATSGLDVTFASDNTGVIAVENGVLVAKSAGTAVVTATQAGDETWEAVTDTKEITVTDLEVQTITWEQNLLLLKLGDEPLTLNAVASSGLAVTYSSADENVVHVSGNTLTVVGVGTTQVTATQAGNSTYAPASMTKAVWVREVSGSCDDVFVMDASSYNLGSSGSKTVALSQPAKKLAFSLYLPGSATGTLTVTENYADGTSNTLLYENSLYNLASAFTGKTISYTDINMSLQAVSVTFSVSGTLDKIISNIVFTLPDEYMVTDKNAIESEVSIGAVYDETLTVNYYNFPDVIMYSHTNNDFALSGDGYFGNGCGDVGSHTIGISFQSYTMGVASDTIVLTCGSQTLRVPVTVHVGKLTQAIQWEQSLADVTIQDTVQLTATASSGLEVTYFSSDESVAVILEGGKLAFAGAGEAEITALQAGNDYYEAAQPMTKTVFVEQIVPEIISLPVAQNLTYGQTLSASALIGGEATVAGTFEWENGSEKPNAGAAQPYAVVFVPEKQALYETVTDTVTVNVSKAAQNIRWEQDLLLLNVGDTVVLTAVAESGLPVSYSTESLSVTLSNDTLIALYAGNSAITATQSGDDNYYSAMPMALNFSVLPADVAIVASPVASDITYGQSLSKSTLSGGQATVPGTFQWANPSYKPDAGERLYEVYFVPDGSDAILMAVMLNVHKAAQTVTWEQDIALLFVGDEIALTAEASSGLAVTYLIGNEDLLAIEDNTLTALQAGRTTILAMQDGDENYEPADGVRLYVTVSEAPTALQETSLPAMAVFPNPAVDVLHVRMTAPMQELRLFDINGRLVLAVQKGGEFETVLQVGSLPRGLYQLLVRTEQGIVTQRVICR